MKTYLLASLLSLSTAVAAPSAPTPPTPPGPPSPSTLRAPDDRCQATGDVLFEIDHDLDMRFSKAGGQVSSLVLYATGAWTLETRSADPRPSTTSGCLDAKQLTEIRKDLERATWHIDHAEITCMAISANYTEYLANGKLVFTERVCSPDSLDKKSAASLADIERILTDASKPRPVPCCKK